MSKKSRLKRHQRAQARGVPWLWLGVAGAVVLLAAGLVLVWTGSNTTPGIDPELAGVPRLAVDKTEVDEGDVKIDTPVQSAFTLKNIGGRPLQIMGEPQVELVEGC